MIPKASLVALVAVVLLAPVTVASTMIWGTEEKPELADPAGDVQYSQLHGNEEAPFIDMTAGWISYENQTDRVTFTVKVVDATALESPGQEYHLECNTTIGVEHDEVIIGSLSVFWAKNQGETNLVSRIEWNPDGERGGSAIAPRTSLDHDFGYATTAPGYYNWTVDRPALLQYGDILRGWDASCMQVLTAGGLRVIYSNFDDGESQSAYSLSELRRLSGPGGEPDPWETASPEPATPSATSPAETAMPGIASMLAVLLAYVVVSRRGSG